MSAFLCTADGRFHCIDPSLTTCHSCCLKRLAADATGVQVPPEDLFVTRNGHIMNNGSKVSIVPGDVFRIQPCLLGGKGGFGSMLRAIGAQIEKTTNREACRDLSGRRMRDVNDEKKITEWVAKQAEKEEEKVRRKQERLVRLREGPKHTFDDRTYTAQIQANAEQIGDALQQGLRAASASAASVSSTSSADMGIKRKTSQEQKRAKKSRMWLSPDEEGFESDEDEWLGDVAGPSGEGCSSITMGNSTSTSGTSASTLTSTVHGRLSGSLLGSSADSDSAGREPPSNVTSENREAAPIQPQTIDEKEGVAEKEEENESRENNSRSSTDKPAAEQSPDQPSKEALEITPLDLAGYSCTAELEALGLERLKSALMALGLKCGGTLQQRAERLFATKGIPLDKLDPSLFAKPSNGKKGKGKKK